jgi:hypothetical protein
MPQDTLAVLGALRKPGRRSHNPPRYPLETFLAGGGDCEDTSILFASMIKAAPVDWEVDLVYMDSDKPDEPPGPSRRSHRVAGRVAR